MIRKHSTSTVVFPATIQGLIKKYTSFVFLMTMFASCGNDPEEPAPVFDPTPYELTYPSYVPTPDIAADNTLTKEKVKLGKKLFHDKRLSSDNTQSCASCHMQTMGFSDPARFSKGVRGLLGRRQAMPVFNLAWHANGFFWDGRSPTLRDQSLRPIQDMLEMNETLPNVLSKVGGDQTYRDQFVRAFGTDEVTTEKISLALEQFMASVVSLDSKYDKFLQGKTTLTESEERGRVLFFKEYNPFFPQNSGADCAHCHVPPFFTNDDYMNNGLDLGVEFKDLGRFEVTGADFDKAAFKMPSLRNIEYTSPYMHDGRFNTLEEVVEHYNSGVKMSPTVSPLIIPTIQKGLGLSAQDKADLVAFLKTLSDPGLLTNPAYAN